MRHVRLKLTNQMFARLAEVGSPLSVPKLLVKLACEELRIPFPPPQDAEADLPGQVYLFEGEPNDW